MLPVLYFLFPCLNWSSDSAPSSRWSACTAYRAVFAYRRKPDFLAVFVVFSYVGPLATSPATPAMTTMQCVSCFPDVQHSSQVPFLLWSSLLLIPCLTRRETSHFFQQSSIWACIQRSSISFQGTSITPGRFLTWGLIWSLLGPPEQVGATLSGRHCTVLQHGHFLLICGCHIQTEPSPCGRKIFLTC